MKNSIGLSVKFPIVKWHA